MAQPLFGTFFVGNSFPITSANLTQVDPTHWVLDVCSLVRPDYWELKEVALFLVAPNTLDPAAALGLYVKAGPSEWLYRGCVHNGHPSEVMPLQVRVERQYGHGVAYPLCSAVSSSRRRSRSSSTAAAAISAAAGGEGGRGGTGSKQLLGFNAASACLSNV
jgi:hypothetical protein